MSKNAKPTTDLQKTEETSLARPDYIPRGNTGREKITRDDILMPRLAICQAMSPQLKESDPKYIEGIRIGHLFNNLTSDVIPQPVSFHVIRYDGPRGIEFYPREQGGGVKDMDVPLNDPRMQFRVDDATGKSLPPVATKFYDFVIITHPLRLGPSDNPMDTMVALSLKGTQIKVAKLLCGLIDASGADVWAQRYRLTTALEKNAKGEFYNFVVKRDGWASPEEFETLKQLHQTLRGATVKIEREPGEDDDTGGM